MDLRIGRIGVGALRKNEYGLQSEVLPLDARTLRHMGITPQRIAADRKKGVDKKRSNPLVQRRLQDRRERLERGEAREVHEEIEVLYYARKRIEARAQFVYPREIEFVE